MTRFFNHENDAEYQQLVHDVAHEISLCFNDEVPAVRLAAIEALTLIKDIDANSTIIPLLKDEMPFIRAKAAESLGTLVYQDSIPNLMSLLSDEVQVLTLDGIMGSTSFRLLAPNFRVCDFAFRALLNFESETILLTFQYTLNEDDWLLKAHTCQAIDIIKGRSNHGSFYARSYSDKDKLDWNDFIEQIKNDSLINEIGNLLSNNRPIINDDLVTELLLALKNMIAESEYVEGVENLEQRLQEFDEIISHLGELWKLPIGYYAVEALSIIRTSESIYLLLAALEASNNLIRGQIIEELGSWLGDFPDSGWSSSRRTIVVDPTVEKLRHDVIERLIPFLNDETVLNITTDKSIRICQIAAQSLSLSGTDKAKLAVEKWQESNRE